VNGTPAGVPFRVPSVLVTSSLLLAVVDPEQLNAVCGADPNWVCERMYDWTGSKFLTNVLDWIVAKPLTIFLIVVIVAVLASLLRRLVSRSMARVLLTKSRTPIGRQHGLRERTSGIFLSSGGSSVRTEARRETLTEVFRSLATVFVWLIGLLFIFETVGVSLGPLLATAGIIGVALGFGTQTMVRDFISGFFIVAEDQFGVGDTIDVGGGAKGTVERVTLRATHIRDSEGNVWHVANGQILKVANKSQEWARALIDVVVPYNTDIDAASGVMQEVADTMQTDPQWSNNILERAEIWGIQEFDADGIHVRMVIKTKPAAQFGVLRELRGRLKIAFEKNGISFGYAGGPTQVILTQKEAPQPKPVVDTKPNMPPSDGGGVLAEGHDDAGFGGDGDGD